MQENYFKGTSKNPYHISIGAVLVNTEGGIATHYFKEKPRYNYLKEYEEFHLLMRETIEPGESIEVCLARGLMEEFGALAKMNSYLGSNVIIFPSGHNVPIEKTTLYFYCELISINNDDRRKHDDEMDSTIVWVKPEELIKRMKEQTVRLNESTIDESIIIERFLKIKLQNNNNI